MMMQLREQAERFGLNVQDKNVESVDSSSRPFKVTVEGEDFFAHSLIVSTRRRIHLGWMLLAKQSRKDAEFRPVQHAMERSSKKRRSWLSVGGDSACEEATFLTRFRIEGHLDSSP
jgi:thioredoxin reductase (NADPH)